MSETHQIDPQQRGEAVQNVKNDSEGIVQQLEGWGSKATPPSQGVVSNINNLIQNLDQILPILAPGDEEKANPVNSRIRATWMELEQAWGTYQVDKLSQQWAQLRERAWKDCAEKAKVFAAVVFALQ